MAATLTLMVAMLDLAVKSTLLLACAAGAVVAMRRASAASRHFVWTSAFCAIAVLPAARLSLPALRVPVLKATTVVRAALLIAEPPPPSIALPPSASSASADTRPAATTLAPTAQWRPPSTTELALVFWLAGAIVLALRHIGGWIALRRIVARADSVTDSRAVSRLDQTARAFDIRRRIILLSHESDGLPCTFGTFRPVILLPAAFLDSAPEADARLDTILVHEVAHIARLDALAGGISQVAVMMFWFNPLMWLAARQARSERERAADDAVLAAGARPSDYAGELLAIARSQSTRLISMALPMAATGLERRVRAILDNRIRRGRRSSISIVFALALLLAMLPLSAARLVARPAPSSNPGLDLRLGIDHAGSTPGAGLRPSALAAKPAPTVTISTATDIQQTPPPASTYLIGVGDVLSIIVWLQKDFSSDMVVGTNGRITLPGAGVDVVASGLTIDQLKAKILAVLVPKYLASPDVFLQVKQINSRREYWPAGQQRQVQQGQSGQGQGQQGQATNQSVVATTRVEMLKNVLGRAQKALKNGLIKVEIGTAAKVDTVTFETTIAQVEQMLLAAQNEQDEAALQPPQQLDPIEFELRRAQMAAALKNLDAAEIRFDNGILTSKGLSDSLMAAAKAAKDLPLSVPKYPVLTNPALDMFSSTNFPNSTAADRSNARALYDLLTGRVASVNGASVTPETPPPALPPTPTDANLLSALQNAPKMASEVDRADALVGIAQRYALTPEMVAAYVAAANSIKSDSERARVFAQPIRVKSPGKGPEWYWQR